MHIKTSKQIYCKPSSKSILSYRIWFHQCYIQSHNFINLSTKTINVLKSDVWYMLLLLYQFISRMCPNSLNVNHYTQALQRHKQIMYTSCFKYCIGSWNPNCNPITLNGDCVDATQICPHLIYSWNWDYRLWMYTMCVELCSNEVTGAVRTCSLLNEMSSAVTLTDPVCLTEWPFDLSQTDVCCCQSHALKNTTGSQNMASDQQTHTCHHGFVSQDQAQISHQAYRAMGMWGVNIFTGRLWLHKML